MFSKPTRSSRISFSYMCMTMSLSSAWIAARPPAAPRIFKHLPDVAELHHAALPVRPDVGREHLDRGVAVLDRLRQRVEHALRQLAVQQQVKAVVAIAGAGPFALAQLDRLLQRLIRRARGEIEQGGRAAMERGAADLLRRRAQQILVAAGERDRRAAMDVRIDAARHDDLPGGVDDPRRADLRRGCPARRSRRSCRR